MASAREEQRKLLNADLHRHVSDEAGVAALVADPESGLRAMCARMVASYQSYPLLCARAPPPPAEDGMAVDSDAAAVDGDAAAAEDGAEAAGEADEGGEGGEGDEGDEGEGACRRTIAVGFDLRTRRVAFGLSGKLRHQGKTHASLWGKSLLQGRPRGTCAEFRVANSLLLAGGRLDDVCLSVVDLMTGAPKPRCRNCLYLTRDAAMVVTDALVWDGDMSKQRRAPQLAKRAGAKPHKVQKRKKR